MSIVHYTGVKVIVAASLAAGAAVAVMDPTTKGYIIAACIAGIPSTISGFFGLFNHIKIGKIATKVDGINSELAAKQEQTAAQLGDTSKLLARAEGRREGIESTEPVNKVEKGRQVNESSEKEKR
jgi:hypothetical protein